MARPIRMEDPELQPLFFRNGVYEDYSYDGITIKNPVLATFVQEIRRRIEDNKSALLEIVS